MKTLVITEKHSVSRNMAKVLGCRSKKKGYFEGDGYIVTWAVGHLATLKMPEEYDLAFKRWKMEDLPILPEKMLLKPVQQTQDQYEIVKKLMHSKDVNEIICATDAGREGELIFRYIYSLAGCTKPVQRLWISSLTDSAIEQGFAKLRPGSYFDNLYDAARCRSEADWLVGLNATRAFTVQHGTMLSVGRVQTPTLALLVYRENDIQKFVPQDYWEVLVDYAEGFWGKWKGDGEGRTLKKVVAEGVQQKVYGKTGFVQDVKQEKRKESPPLLYDLTELQRDGNKKFGYSAQQVLDLAQRLYEKKLITYPRTNSRYLSKDIDTLEIVAHLRGYERYTERIKQAGWTLQGRNINENKITDHHAIIPTGEKGKMTVEEEKVFDLVARRFCCGFFPDHLYKVKTITAEIEQEIFISKGKAVTQQGWKELYAKASATAIEAERNNKPGQDQDQEQEQQLLPDLNKGDAVNVRDVKLKQKQTKPPSRYTDASILSAMENAGKLVNDEELRERMQENGLGTPATRASIIERLLKVGYVERKGKTLVPTVKGMALVEMMPDTLKSPELTGSWEKKLYDIERGKLKPDQYIDDIKGYTREIVKLAGESKSKAIAPGNRHALGLCPVCGGAVIENTKGYGCSFWKKSGCKFFLGKIAGKKLSKKQVRDLLEEGQTKTIKGFTSRKGTKFAAALKYTNGKLEFLFERATKNT